MGLPIFITPAEPEVASKAADKLTPAPRSSIRRQRTIRGGSQARSSDTRRRRIQDLLEDAEREIGQSSIGTGPDMPSIASLQSRAHRFYESERANALNERTSSEVSWERRHLPDGPSLPPAPDPELESRTNLERERERLLHARATREREIERLHAVRRDLRRMGRRRPAPTPPYTETDIAFMARTARMYRDSPVPSSLTPARSPDPVRRSPPEGDADISTIRNSARDELSNITARAARYRELRDTSMRELEAEVAGRSSSADRPDRVHIFNRVPDSNVGPSRSFRQFLHQARMDGLGDRDRSLSPEGGNSWDTLLTSITPDPQPPSAGSSFASASAAAAAASSSSNSGPTWTSGTAVTSPGSPEELPGLHDCDEPTSLDSNTDDEDGELYDLDSLLRSNHREDQLWRSSYADVARTNRGAQSPDSSLEGMQRIISRLAERNDIPESWWASAGLRREPSA